MDLIRLGLVTLLLATQLTTALISPNIIRQCVNSTQIQPADLALFYGTDFIMVTKPAKCYVACISDNTGITKDGKVSDDFAHMAKNAAQANRFKIISEICGDLNVEGECEATYEAFKCWLESQKH